MSDEKRDEEFTAAIEAYLATLVSQGYTLEQAKRKASERLKQVREETFNAGAIPYALSGTHCPTNNEIALCSKPAGSRPAGLSLPRRKGTGAERSPQPGGR